MTPRRRPTPAILRPRPATTVDFSLGEPLPPIRPDPGLELGYVLGVMRGPALLEPLVGIGREHGQSAEPLEHRGARPMQLGSDLVHLHPPRPFDLAFVQAVYLGVPVRFTDSVEPSLRDRPQGARGVRAPE